MFYLHEQSSTFVPPEDSTGQGGKAAYAVDSTLMLSHTDCEKLPWWQVDLATEHEVTEVVVSTMIWEEKHYKGRGRFDRTSYSHPAPWVCCLKFT